MSSFCSDPLDAYPVQLALRKVGVFTIVIACCYIFMGLLNIYLIKLQEWQALSSQDIDDFDAPKSLVFPVFVRVLWANSAIVIIIGIFYLAFPYEPDEHQNFGVIFAYAVVFSLEHVVMEGVAFLLMRKGLGWNAAKKSAKYTAAWSLFVFACKLLSYIFRFSNIALSLSFDLIWQIVLLIFYTALWLAPPHRLFRRPSAIIYARFWTIFRIVSIIADVLQFFDSTKDVAHCTQTFGVILVFALFEPIILFFTLLRDSMWWQGIRIRTGRANRGKGEAIKTPLNGIDLNLKSAQKLAESVDDMIKGDVRLLNFAYIELDRESLLGSGSFSKVYKGSYRKQTCAIKIIFTVDLTEAVINRVAAEAHILSQIKHPNVIKIFGVSVLPPSVCILLELCEYGSLNNVVSGLNIDDYEVGMKASKDTAQLTLRRADRIFLALGCARGLAALHDIGPDSCHRDVKSFNFLVDKHLNVKIADLELGTSSSAEQRESSDNVHDIPSQINSNPMIPSQSNAPSPAPSITNSRFSLTSKLGGDNDVDSILSSIDLDSRGSAAHYGLWKNEILANWAAPEVIQTGRHVKASDVYSLSLVLWEILSGRVPYSEVTSQLLIRRMVLKGERPELPKACFKISPNHDNWSHYAALIERGWQHEAKLRPTASEIVSELECMWKDVGHSAIFDTECAPDFNKFLSCVLDEMKVNRSNSIVSNNGSFSNGNIKSQANAQTTGAQLSFSWSNSRRPSMSPSFDSIRDEFQSEVIKVVASDPSISFLDKSKQPWCLVTAQAPHLLVYTNTAFTDACGLSCNAAASNLPILEDDDRPQMKFSQVRPPQYAAGVPLANIMRGKMTDNDSMWQFISSIEEKSYGHTLATLHKGVIAKDGPTTTASFTLRGSLSARKNSINMPTINPLASEKTNELGDYSLFSIHSFPVLRRASSSQDDQGYDQKSSSDEGHQDSSISLQSSGIVIPSTESLGFSPLNSNRKANQLAESPYSSSPSKSFFSSQFLQNFTSQANNPNAAGTLTNYNNTSEKSTFNTFMRIRQNSHVSTTAKVIPPGGVVYYALLFSEIKETSVLARLELLHRSATNSQNSHKSASSRVRSFFARSHLNDGLKQHQDCSASCDDDDDIQPSHRSSEHSVSSTSSKVSKTSRQSLRKSLLYSVRYVNEKLFAERNLESSSGRKANDDSRGTITKEAIQINSIRHSGSNFIESPIHISSNISESTRVIRPIQGDVDRGSSFVDTEAGLRTSGQKQEVRDSELFGIVEC